MPLLINKQPVDADSWVTVNEDNQDSLLASDQNIIAPLALYLEQAEQLAGRNGKTGVLVTGEDDLDAILALADNAPLIAVEIPALRDGRCFSIARLLKRAGYAGELRATGDVSHDRLDFLTRCGFTALDVPADRYSDEALNAFSEFSVRYQGADDDSRPVYRR